VANGEDGGEVARSKETKHGTMAELSAVPHGFPTRQQEQDNKLQSRKSKPQELN
jgi:hypothetical protein